MAENPGSHDHVLPKSTRKFCATSFSTGNRLVSPPSDKIVSPPSRDLARNEEFSEIAVINIFFTVLKTKIQLSVGGGSCGENVEIIHAIDMQANKKDTSILLDLCANTLSPA